jgi:hypothetical protein
MLTPWINISRGSTPLDTDSFKSSATTLRRNVPGVCAETHLYFRQHRWCAAKRKISYPLQEENQAFSVCSYSGRQKLSGLLIGNNHGQTL